MFASGSISSDVATLYLFGCCPSVSRATLASLIN